MSIRALHSDLSLVYTDHCFLWHSSFYFWVHLGLRFPYCQTSTVTHLVFVYLYFSSDPVHCVCFALKYILLSPELLIYYKCPEMCMYAQI